MKTTLFVMATLLVCGTVLAPAAAETTGPGDPTTDVMASKCVRVSANPNNPLDVYECYVYLQVVW